MRFWLISIAVVLAVFGQNCAGQTDTRVTRLAEKAWDIAKPLADDQRLSLMSDVAVIQRI